jgi:hypothetical protein
MDNFVTMRSPWHEPSSQAGGSCLSASAKDNPMQTLSIQLVSGVYCVSSSAFTSLEELEAHTRCPNPAGAASRIVIVFLPGAAGPELPISSNYVRLIHLDLLDLIASSLRRFPDTSTGSSTLKTYHGLVLGRLDPAADSPHSAAF